jgi:L-serine deaminase
MAVLNSTSKRTPIDEAIEAIKKIKKNHPDAYEKASRLGVPATQPLSPPSDGPKAFRSGI